MKKYIVQDRETGTFIEEFYTLKDAKKCIEEFEEQDKIDGIYEKDFYEVYDTETEEVVY